MNQINVRPRVQAFVSWAVLTEVQEFLNGTELLHSAEEQVRRELEHTLQLNAEWGFVEGAVMAYGASSDEILADLKDVSAPDLLLISPEAAAQAVASQVGQRFKRVLYTLNKDEPFRKL